MYTFIVFDSGTGNLTCRRTRTHPHTHLYLSKIDIWVLEILKISPIDTGTTPSSSVKRHISFPPSTQHSISWPTLTHPVVVVVAAVEAAAAVALLCRCSWDSPWTCALSACSPDFLLLLRHHLLRRCRRGSCSRWRWHRSPSCSCRRSGGC